MFVIIEIFLGIFAIVIGDVIFKRGIGGIFSSIFGEIFNIIVEVGILFAVVGISQLVAKYFNKEANFSKTFQILVYSYVVPSLFLLIPILLNSILYSIKVTYISIVISAATWIAAFTYYIFLAVIGLTQTYNISKGKAVAVVLAPAVVLGIPALLILFFASMYFAAFL